LTAYSGYALCGKRAPILCESGKFKELGRKYEKGRENGGFEPLVFANVQLDIDATTLIDGYLIQFGTARCPRQDRKGDFDA
jgi:hypothetical protein